jgi:hypothetical protein
MITPSENFALHQHNHLPAHPVTLLICTILLQKPTYTKDTVWFVE